MLNELYKKIQNVEKIAFQIRDREENQVHPEPKPEPKQSSPNDRILLTNLIAKTRYLEDVAKQIQIGEEVGLSEERIEVFHDEYESWYIKGISVLPENLRTRFRAEFEGQWFNSGVKSFIEEPTKPSILHPTDQSKEIFSFWQFPFSNFRSRLRTQKQILLEAQNSIPSTESSTLNTSELYNNALSVVKESDDNLCFVIMSFSHNPRLKDFYDLAIKPSVQQSGYKCERVDEQQFNGSIRDKIIHNIRQAKFVIADMTEARPNCYYELAIAHTLGKPVIHITNNMSDIHFDIHDFNFITYERIDELSKALQKRIEETIGIYRRI